MRRYHPQRFRSMNGVANIAFPRVPQTCITQGEANWKKQRNRSALRSLASPAGFEPTAPGLGILCSILLSYGDFVCIFSHSALYPSPGPAFGKPNWGISGASEPD